MKKSLSYTPAEAAKAPAAVAAAAKHIELQSLWKRNRSNQQKEQNQLKRQTVSASLGDQ